jgi:hypothetical protein
MNEAHSHPSESGWRWPSWIIVLILMGVALALRWRYVQDISLSVDEFNTIWAARHVLVRGIPSFPSGNIYPHGFVFTYLVVPFVLGDFSEALARIPGVIVSLAALPAAFWVGRRMFDDRVGVIAAAALAVDPDAVLWGGRARMYGLLQLLTIIVFYVYYRGLTGGRARDRYLAMGLVVVAIFVHAEAVLLLPALAVATLVAWPWQRPIQHSLRQLLRRDVVLPFLLAAAGAGVFFLMSKFGQPGHLETLQESRPYLDLTADVLSGPQVFGPVFVAPHRLPFTLLAIGGLYFVLRPRFDGRAPLTYLYTVLLALLVPLLVLAGATWRNERYLFLLLPLLYFGAGEVLARLIDLAPRLRRTRPWQPVVLAVVVALYVGLTGTGLAYQPEMGYDQAFRTLRQWLAQDGEEGDRVVTVSPSACAVYLEECDYFAIQRGYEEFVVTLPGDGVLVDLWSATPVLTDTAAFVDLLSTAPTVWFVTDSWRFQTRYDGDFVQAVLENMEPVYEERGVVIYRGEGYGRRPPPEFERELQANFDRALALTGFGLSPAQLEPGQELEVTLYWQALEEAGVGYTAFLHLLAPDDGLQPQAMGVAGVDAPVLDGRYQPDFWPDGMTFADQHTLALPSDLPPGRYRLDLGLYPTGQSKALLPLDPPPEDGSGDRLPLAMLTAGSGGGGTPSAAMTPALLDFGQQIRLLGYDLARSDQPATFKLRLYWQALQPAPRDYTVFAHLVGPDGAIISQDDGPPGDPFFPTTTWLPGDTVADDRTLALPDGAPPGDYAIALGLYHQPTGQRLEVTDAHGEPQGDAFRLGPLSVGSGTP